MREVLFQASATDRPWHATPCISGACFSNSGPYQFLLRVSVWPSTTAPCCVKRAMAQAMIEERAKYAKKTNLLWTEEWIGEYCPGGYHPVTLGDWFKEGRYQVRHKLGHGGYAIIWLVRDVEEGIWAALKIKKAEARTPCNELDVLQSLQSNFGKKTDRPWFSALLDDFIHEGPNGNHQCLVFELLGPSLANVINFMRDMNYSSRDKGEEPEFFEPENILRLARQLLEALANLHEAGFCHGDLSSSNVAFTYTALVPSDDNEKVFETLGEPETDRLTHKDGSDIPPGKPTQFVGSAHWDDPGDENEEDLRLIDFGESFSEKDPPNSLAQAWDFRAPEFFFSDSDTYEIDHKVDLWAAGLIIYHMIFLHLPFDSDYDEHEYAKSIVREIGQTKKLPDRWREEIERNPSGVKEDSDVKAGPSSKKAGKSWDEVKKEVKECGPRIKKDFKKADLDDDVRALRPIVRKLLRLRKEDRIEAREALEMLDEIEQ